MASRRGISLGLLLALLGAAVTAGAWSVNRWAVDNLLRQTAVEGSEDAARYFSANMPGLPALLEGKPPSPEALAFIETGLRAKGVDAFKLYGRTGHLLLDTEQLKDAKPGADALGSHNPDAFQALSLNRSFVALELEEESGAQELLSETYVPIDIGGKLAGVAEVYIDQTATAERFRQSFFWSTGLIAAIVGLGFFIPAHGFLRRTRQKIAAEERVRFLATHDALTGLPNRQSFTESLAAVLAKPADPSTLLALHHINIDGFKAVNEQHGHEFGNEVLKAVAGRLQGAVRESDMVSRIAADEFIVLQNRLADPEEVAGLTARLAAVFRDPVHVGSENLPLSASMGTALALAGGCEAQQLLENADTASSSVKSRGGNGHCFFEERLNAAKRARLEIEALLRKTLAEHGFELHFQPLFSCDENKLKGFEALLRLRNADGLYVRPDKFIPVAEELGLIDEIGAWVLRTACETAAGWPAGLQISVNLSAIQFRRQTVVPATREALKASGLSPSRLLLEITESTLLSDADGIISQLAELKELGVAIVMDDFGTGYSSLSYMLRFPFDRLKIDRSFVNALSEGGSNAVTVIETIIALGHTMKMNVTAEGVETESQAATLRGLRCDDAQGYLFGRPMPASDVSILLLRQMADRPRHPVAIEAGLPAAAGT